MNFRRAPLELAFRGAHEFGSRGMLEMSSESSCSVSCSCPWIGSSWTITFVVHPEVAVVPLCPPAAGAGPPPSSCACGILSASNGIPGSNLTTLAKNDRLSGATNY